MQLANDDFSPVHWTPGTRLILSEAAWDSSYRDIVDFKGVDAVYDYISGHGMAMIFERSTPVLPGRPIRLDIPYELATRYNYIAAHNPNISPEPYDNAQKSGPSDYFYFVTDVRYASPHATDLVLQLDVWATYGCRAASKLQFGRSMLKRGHLPMVLKERWHSHGRTWLNCPEDLELGSALAIGQTWGMEISSTWNSAVLVWTSVAIEEDNGSVDNPQLKTARGSGIENLPNGLAAYCCDNVEQWINVVNELHDKPWVTSGIQAVMLVAPQWLFPVESDEVHVGNAKIQRIRMSAPYHNRILVIVEAIHDKIREFYESKGNVYGWLDKFRMAPFTSIELTFNNGAPLVLEPQLISEDNLAVTEYCHMALPAPRIMWAVRNYNVVKQHVGDDDDDWMVSWKGDMKIRCNWGEDMDVATGMTNFPQFSVLNDGYLNSIASQAHSLQYARENAAWQRDVSLQGNQLSYDQSTAATQNMLANNNIQRNLNSQLTGIANQASWDSTAVNSAVAGVGVVGSALSGNVGAAVQGLAVIAGGVASTAISTGARSASTSASNAASGATASNNANLQNYVRDTNKAYADFAANGNYAQQIASINAKMQDARITQPSISGQAGGDAFLMATQGWCAFTKLKTLAPGVLQRIGDFWLRYGYAVRRYIDMRGYPLQVMKKFTYWELTDTHIGGDMPEFAKQAIRGIFEKGVTVWSDPDDIIPCPIYDNKPEKRDY